MGKEQTGRRKRISFYAPCLFIAVLFAGCSQTNGNLNTTTLRSIENGDYVKAMATIENQTVTNDGSIFTHIFAVSDPKSPYFNPQEAIEISKKLETQYPTSIYTPQAKVIASLMEQYLKTNNMAKSLETYINKLNDSITRMEEDIIILKDTVRKHENQNVELVKNNTQLRKKLNIAQERLEAIKEIDLKTKMSTDESKN